MKKTKLATLLIMPLLLTGCDADLSKISQPNFAPVGSQISYDDFMAAYEEAADKIDINQEALLKSKEMSYKNLISVKSGSYQNVNTVKPKTITKNETIVASKEQGTTKYDSKKNIILTKETYDFLDVFKDQTGTVKEDSTIVTETGVAVVDIDDGKSAITFNNKTMTYSVTKAFGDGEEPAPYVDMQFKMGCHLNLLTPFTTYLPKNEEVKAFYKFYQNGNTFTYVYSDVTTQENIDSNSIVVSKDHIDENIKVQLELSENKQALKYYTSTKTTTTYIVDGKFDETTIEAASEISVKNRSVSLKAIKLSRYDAVE